MLLKIIAVSGDGSRYCSRVDYTMKSNKRCFRRTANFCREFQNFTGYRDTKYRNIACDFESWDNDPKFVFLSFSGPLVSKGIDGDLSAYIPGKKKKTSEFCCKFLIFQIACDCFAVALRLN